MDLNDFFSPINTTVVDYHSSTFRPSLGDGLQCYVPGGQFPDWQDSRLALLGVEEDRGSVEGDGSAPAPDFIRRKLYRLARPHADLRMVDLGNIAAGQTVADTYSALTEALAILLDAGITAIVIGGSDDLMFPIYKAYERIGRVINITSIDSRFNLEGGDTINSCNYLQHIILQQPNYLFDYTNLGYQTYFVGHEMVNLMQELKFGAHRIGELQGNIELAEPLIRYADVVGLDTSAIRQSDAPAAASPSPHGFYGEQVCQLARYAGMSDKDSTFALFEMIPAHDRQGEQTAHLLAHVLWFFIEGFFYRLGDIPSHDRQSYKRFNVVTSTAAGELTFYKSLKSDRWWLEVPCEDPERQLRFGRHQLIPCAYADYEQTLHDDIPALWQHYYNRFNN